MGNQGRVHQKEQIVAGQREQRAGKSGFVDRSRLAIKVASYLWVPAGLLIGLFFGRTIARAYAMMPGVMSEAFLIQTVCPLIKTQIRVFWGWAHRLRGPTDLLVYGR